MLDNQNVHSVQTENQFESCNCNIMDSIPLFIFSVLSFFQKVASFSRTSCVLASQVITVGNSGFLSHLLLHLSGHYWVLPNPFVSCFFLPFHLPLLSLSLSLSLHLSLLIQVSCYIFSLHSLCNYWLLQSPIFIVSFFLFIFLSLSLPLFFSHFSWSGQPVTFVVFLTIILHALSATAILVVEVPSPLTGLYLSNT